MLKNNTSIVDDRGYNQGFRETEALLKRMERRADWIIEAMDQQPGKKVLEIGCGTGFLSYVIATKTKMQVLGSDLCVPFIDEASAKYVHPTLKYMVLDFNLAAEKINHKFDYIIGNGILHHLYYNLDNVFVTFKNILEPNGKIIFMEPNIYNPYVAAIFKNKKLRKVAKLEPDEMAFSMTFIRKKLEAAGFKNIDITYKDFLLPGIPEWAVKPSILIGNIVEKTPLKFLSQSILIKATM
jgi:2-polyprenyl-3-methyl-5-hydroxy-6-metoxy-1,4-benzoquinol methylase